MFKILRSRKKSPETDQLVAEEEPPLSEAEKLVRERLQEIANKGFYPVPHVKRIDYHAMILGRGALEKNEDDSGSHVAEARIFYMQEASKKDTDMHIRSIEVEPTLRNRGIGSILLARAVQSNLRFNPFIETVSTGPITPAHARIMQKVFGEVNVHIPGGSSIENGLMRSGVRAIIDRERIESIDTDQKLRELPENGRIELFD